MVALIHFWAYLSQCFSEAKNIYNISWREKETGILCPGHFFKIRIGKIISYTTFFSWLESHCTDTDKFLYVKSLYCINVLNVVYVHQSICDLILLPPKPLYSLCSSRIKQHYAQICTTALFYILASTCFGSILPSSGSFWIRLSYIKMQVDLVVYLKYITDKN
jgi:hypothetical protein